MKTCQQKKLEALNRRDFCKKSLALGAAVYGASLFGWVDTVAAQDPAAMPDLVAVKNGEPDVMFDKAIEAMGGIGKFVKQGQIVVVKPNIGWNRGPETAANTNPLLVKRIVEHCLNAGAKKVYVFDHGVDYSVNTYKTSGIEEAAKAGGAIVVPSEDLKYYQKVTIPGAEKLKEPQVHEALLEAEVLINVPVLKNHFASQLTIAMKNLMGVVWDRGEYHGKGLHQCITEFCLYRKPDLNVLDAYLVTTANGPQSARESDRSLQKTLLISQDIVAIDAAGAKILGVDPEKIAHIKLGHEKKLGNMNLEGRNIQRIVL
jgi:uncharacterized protein (DUF362 family)